MPQRNITGPVVDAAGIPVASGELHVTPQVPAGTAADGFVIEKHIHAIESGAVTAPVIVPGEYKIELFDAAGTRLRSFSAAISDASLADISLKEVWETRAGAIDLPPATMLEGDSILRLTPGKGMNGDLLQQADGKLVWGKSPNDMRSAVYDPHGRRGDVYNRANHIGSQPASSIAGLNPLLGLMEYASVCDRKPMGTQGGTFQSGADRLRTLNTVVVNNSGLADALLLDLPTSAVTLVPGRIYVGWAEAPAFGVGSHYLKLKSTDGAIALVGPGQYADSGGGTGFFTMARVDFRIVVPADSAARQIQIYHRAQFTWTDYGMGTQLRFPADPGLMEEYARMIILSRPL